ncbi:MAG: hypothetical protein UT24_C0003G0080 [Candidatus Woesebacteria bacterium GW2011_GWB1_39_12]|uniref:Uncharacterized protein n=1 Tax=Candidatus Woesebacteria bacterium GW2011_GWB1_39_12 TaxID=1618574 RepID=A0A0G0MER7_9BACT|nr:MAG: hypothetical protein UT24_C0003G0080 [Candidatus Woesebacteria bacterium GW2011_GWB1_39_12]
MGLKEKLVEYGVTKRTAPAAAILIPIKSLLFMYAVTFMVDKLGPLQIQVLGLSVYALFTEGTGWFISIVGNDIAKNLFGMSNLVDKFLFRTISDISYILIQVALAAVFFIILQIIFM